jgi:hypothetical protein
MQDNVAAILTPLSKDAATQTEFILSPDSSPFFAEVYRTLWNSRHARTFRGHIGGIIWIREICQKASRALEDGEEENEFGRILADDVARGT